MIKLRPFFSYFGSKWRLAPKYPEPRYDMIIEPFAGSAGYSLRYYERQIVLYDLDPVIAGLWDYLIHVKESEIRGLPSIVNHVDDVDCCQEAKWLIGFIISPSQVSPRKNCPPYKYACITRDSWGDVSKNSVADQLQYIRHWRIYNASYRQAPAHYATWFLDPPYCGASGIHYKYNNVNFQHLGNWCKNQYGQVIVCESFGADWLPFEKFKTPQTGCINSHSLLSEAIWTQNRDYPGAYDD